MGALGCWEFWARWGQESLQNPGDREMDRVLLAGWVISRFCPGFGQSIKHQAEFGQSNGENNRRLGN
jgi:hypothetical protein